MPFNLQHVLVSETMEPEVHEGPQGTFFTVAQTGQFQVLYPGRLLKNVNATVRHSMRIDTPDTTVPDIPGGIDQPGGGGGLGGHPTGPTGNPHPLHNGVTVTIEAMPLDLRIFTPDGKPFTKDEVTLGDLEKFRDQRGLPVGHWLYSVHGRSRDYALVADFNETVTDPKGIVEFTLTETVASHSAPPLVPNSLLTTGQHTYKFDLYRVGTFLAQINQLLGLGNWRGSMRLLDPDGAPVASSSTKILRCDIPLAWLGKSRDVAGAVRQWTLEVTSLGGGGFGPPHISATVIGSGRIGTAAIQERIAALLGPHGSFIQLVGENSGGQARARLTITDVVSAETIDMQGLLDKPLRAAGQSTDIVANKTMTLFSASSDLDYGLSLDVGSIKLKTIDIEIGPGRGLGADVPVVRLTVKAEGHVRVNFGSLSVADAALRDGKAEIEVGIKLDPDGTPRMVSWAPDKPFDIDLDNGAIAVLIATLGLVGFGIAEAITEYIEFVVNEGVSEGAKSLFDDPTLAPTVLMTIFGTHLTYRPVRFDGPDILFEHVAPSEPDPKPRGDYVAVIGRSLVSELGPGLFQFHPMTLGDTWAADNLINKIDHVVAVMMENRSYDHVLGYRARAPISDGADGLTDPVIAAVQGDPAQHIVRPLSQAGFESNAVGLKTRIPKGVGHEFDDVAQQLAGQIPGPGGVGHINDPKGFVDNFRDKELKDSPAGCVPDDVLGYYEANDLPIYAYLAENYAYCDHYFCSHPGPTLPNRMFSLTGDLQYDRLGVPLVDSNHGDNVMLSRAETIYDLLTKRGVSWRVYELAPSVTMLRMYARYATNDTDILPLSRLEGDIAAGDLPSFTYIEPMMHSHPEDDDHPDADMYRGQMFIKRVYDALRSNPEVWRRTLLIITYDEHGGLYDHVVPPLAEIRAPPRFGGLSVGGDVVMDPGTGGGDGGGTVGGGGVFGGATGGLSTGGTTAGGGAAGGGAFGGLGDIAIDPDDLTLATEDTHPTPAPDPNVRVPYGVRVPTFVVSPWTMRGKGPGIILDHCSILKTVLARFSGGDKPFLSDRVRASHSFEDFLTEASPRMDVGPSPGLGTLPPDARRLIPGASQIDTPTISRKRLREESVDYHEISGWVARMLGR